MNPHCPNCRAGDKDVVKFGHYYRHCDSRTIQRFMCKRCHRHFSRATSSARYRQKKRRINHTLKHLLGSCISMRRAAILLKVSRTTVARRLPWLAEQANQQQLRCLQQMPLIETVQFDDLITIEHTKLKPLSVTVVVDPERWQILGLCVAQIPCSGLLAAKSREKYGKRPDKSRFMRKRLLEELRPYLSQNVTFITDEHKDYGTMIRRLFPQAIHVQHKSIKSRHGGQGELKQTGFDPLFCINQILAMLRANINRLIRRTWCTTKRPDCLQNHLDLFVDYYNRFLTPRQPQSTGG